MAQVEVKDTETAKIVASGLIHEGGLTPSKGFSVDPPGGLEVLGEDHGWIFNVDDEQAAVIRFWLGEDLKLRPGMAGYEHEAGKLDR